MNEAWHRSTVYLLSSEPPAGNSGPPLEKDDAIFYALLRMGHECTHAIIPHPHPLSKKTENTWLIEVEHEHNDLGKHGQYTFCYKIVDDPKTAVGECRKGLNDLT